MERFDRHQIAEFNTHWGQSYILVNKDLVWVERLHDDVAQTFRGRKIIEVKAGAVVAGDPEVFNIADAEPIDLRAGFIQPATGGAMLITRTPYRGTRRGICPANTQMMAPSINRGDLEFTLMNLSHVGLYYCLNKDRKKKRDYMKELGGIFHSGDKGFSDNFAISSDYIVGTTISRTAGVVGRICGQGGVIGSVHRTTGDIVISRKVDHLIDSVQKDFHVTFGYEGKISVSER